MQFPCAVDSHRRLAIPKLWRLDSDTEDTLFYLALGTGPSLEFYEYAEFERRQLAVQQSLKDDLAYLQATAAAYTTVVTLDKQGRFVIPQPLLDDAEIKSNVYCVGAYTHGAIFAAEIWEKIRLPKQDVITYNHKLSPSPTVLETKVLVTETQ